MHAALQLPELLRVILACLPSKLPACLTCRLFSEVTLDFVWKDLPDISVFPFLTPLEYETTLNPDHPCYDAVLHMQHVERLKFYGRRVHGLTVVRDIQVTPALLSCIARAGHDTPQSSTPSSPLTAILPQLTTLCPWSPAQDDGYDIRIEFRLRTFLLPSVTNLTLNFSARATDFAMMNALRCVRLIKCSLRSLELREILDEDSEFMALGPRQPGTMLVSQFADLVCNLPFLESLRIPLFLFNTVTVPTIGASAPLQHLGLDTFGQYSWDHSSIVPPQESGLAPFPALQSLSIAAPSDVIPLVLYPRTPIAAQISRLTLKCVFPNNKDSQVAFCKSAFAPPHGIQGLLTLEHLVITALVMYRTDLIPDSLGKEFFQPIFSSPFISRLVTFSIGYDFVLDIDDRDLEEMASLMPNLKSISLAPVPSFFFCNPADGSQVQPRIRATLAALQSFAKHCPKLHDISLLIDATLPPPALEACDPAFSQAIILNIASSPVSGNLVCIAKFLARLFPNDNSVLLFSECRWLAKGGDADNDSEPNQALPGVGEEGEDFEEEDAEFKQAVQVYMSTIDRGWREVIRQVRDERRRCREESPT